MLKRLRSPLPYQSRVALSKRSLCLTYNVVYDPEPGASLSLRSRSKGERYASTLTSSTAIHATKAIPARYAKLYEALNDVKKKAPTNVNLSRLQLALQGLESEKPTTRVAILGLNVKQPARRLVRLLLADALEDEARWEKQLSKVDEKYSRGLLIRYGHPPNDSLPQPRTVVPVIYIPAPVLQRNNIEILISTVKGPQNGGGSRNNVSTSSDTFLSPVVGTPADTNGRTISLNQPVHKSLLIAEGINDLLIVAELLVSTDLTPTKRQMVDVVLNLKDASSNSTDTTLAVDMMKAEEGLAAVRASISNATTYEHKWVESGMPSLSRWLTLASASKTSTTLSAPVKNLISSLLISASENVVIEAAQAAQALSARSMSIATRVALDDAISNFSRNAHQELQSGLASAWSSRNWRKLAWYKLFWRVDDVGLIITDLVTNAWLPRTERAVYELSGRLTQTGISPVLANSDPIIESIPSVAVGPEAKPMLVLQSEVATTGQGPTQAVLVNQAGSVSVEVGAVPRPVHIATTISTKRHQYMGTAITDLTTTAQQLVLRSLSISGLTAGLSGLAYFSVAAGSVYEAGTIVALGTAFALWRMQTDWQRSCKALEDGLMSAGQVAISETEESMRSLVKHGGMVAEAEIEVQTRQEALAAIEKAKIALEEVA